MSATALPSTTHRLERDFLGKKPIPIAAYWGVHTARAIENFPISGTPISAMPDLIRALAMVKKAATRANADLGALDRKRAAAIIWACNALIDGQHHDQFVVDVIQGGAGTSTNMNANEVLANIALEKLGFDKGRYDVLHPNDHVNASQSTNDVYPTAVRLSLWMGIERLLASMAYLRKGFEAKADEFKDILKIGRTQLQDAVPMTLGQEFSTYAVMIGEDEARLSEARALIEEINLGATAIGTGINAPAGYADMACQYLAEDSAIPVKQSPNLVEATQDTGLCNSRVCSNALPASSPKSATTCACSPVARRRALATSSCPRAKRARPSCPARSTP
jgi:aspartate ammonia-lyase